MNVQDLQHLLLYQPAYRRLTGGLCVFSMWYLWFRPVNGNYPVDQKVVLFSVIASL